MSEPSPEYAACSCKVIPMTDEVAFPLGVPLRLVRDRGPCESLVPPEKCETPECHDASQGVKSLGRSGPPPPESAITLARRSDPCEISDVLPGISASLRERPAPSQGSRPSASILRTLRHSQSIVIPTRYRKDFDNLLMCHKWFI